MVRDWIAEHFFGAVLLLSILGLIFGLIFTYFIAMFIALWNLTVCIFLALSGIGVGSG